MAGAMGSELDRLYSSTLGETYMAHSNRTTAKGATQKDIVAEYVSAYEKDNLVQYMSGRFKKYFPKFEYVMNVVSPIKIKKALRRHGQKIDDVCESYPHAAPHLEIFEQSTCLFH